MYENSAFSAGVRFGGLTDRTEIKILICYLLTSTMQPLSEEQLIEAVIGQQLVNYFELQDALSHLLSNSIIIEKDGKYHISDEGKSISKELEKALPFSVRERAYKAVISLLQYETLKRQNKTAITPLKKGGFNLNCTIDGNDFTLFSVDVFMPDEKSAKLAEEQFIRHGQDIFKCVLGITTETPAMYKDFLESIKENKE